MALTLNHQTASEFAARFWTRLQRAFNTGDKIQYSRMIWWLSNRITAGDLTSTQVRDSFNLHFGRSLNTTQWNSLVQSRFIPARDRYQAMLDEAAL